MGETIPNSYVKNPPRGYEVKVYPDIKTVSFRSRRWVSVYYTKWEDNKLHRNQDVTPLLISSLVSRGRK